MKRLGCLVLLVGCGFQSSPPVVPIDANNQVTPDTPPADSSPEVPDARVCFGTGLVNVCLSRAPTQAVSYSGTSSIDTGRSQNCTQTFQQTNGPEICVIAGTTVTVAGTLTVTGSRPLVLIGATTVSVPGILDLSSTTGTNPRRTGAGANPGQGLCGNIVGPENDSGGAGGGAGGSFASKGGDGGTGDQNNSAPPAGSAKGGTAAAALGAPTVLRGGCRGGNGGDGDNQHRGGNGGDGGGAVYLIAGTSITIEGEVYASGAGGLATPGSGGAEQGGGGGGTGGMIGLDALMINISGHLVANGGGGGGGGAISTGGTPGGDGANSSNITTTSWNARATRGIRGDGGAAGDGGDGAPGTAINATDMVGGAGADGGGGGAGGGVGIVWIDGAVTGGTMISPTPTAH